jgi:hypothetical protein
LYIKARDAQSALTPWDAWVAVFNNAAAEAKTGVAIAKASQLVMADAYKFAAETGNYSGIPTYTEAVQLMKGYLKKSDLQAHHTIPKWLQDQLMALTGKTWDKDAAPAILLDSSDHIGAGEVSFHNILDQFLPEGGTYNEQEIMDGLQKAYTKFGTPNVWNVAQKWITDVLH